MRRALATVVVLLAAVGVGVGINIARSHQETRPSVQPAPPGVPAETTIVVVPAPGQSIVTGSLTSFHADNAVGPPLQPPFTVTIPVRGRGSADITGVDVAGQSVGIFWYGGQPLPVSGDGQLVLDGAPVAVDTGGITWTLDGSPRTLNAGHFSLGAPVAVGPGGLATPHDRITFDAGARATMTTTGNATVHLPPSAIRLSGPGRHVVLDGDFQVQTTSGTRRAHTITFGPGSYSLDLRPAPGGDTIRATLQGPVSLG